MLTTVIGAENPSMCAVTCAAGPAAGHRPLRRDATRREAASIHTHSDEKGHAHAVLTGPSPLVHSLASAAVRISRVPRRNKLLAGDVMDRRRAPRRGPGLLVAEVDPDLAGWAAVIGSDGRGAGHRGRHAGSPGRDPNGSGIHSSWVRADRAIISPGPPPSPSSLFPTARLR